MIFWLLDRLFHARDKSGQCLDHCYCVMLARHNALYFDIEDLVA